MIQAIDERVKYNHNWYKIEAMDNNGYIEAYREKDMKKVYDKETLTALRMKLRR